MSLWAPAPGPSSARPHAPTHEAHGPAGRVPDGWCDGRGSRGARGKVHPSRGGDTARGRPVGGPGDQAGLPGCADAARSRPAVDGVARSRGSAPHSRPAPASRTRRCRTPPGTPPRGSAAFATPRLWPSPRHAAAPARCDEATWRDVGDRPNGVGGRRRASGRAAITRTRSPTTARSHARRAPRDWLVSV